MILNYVSCKSNHYQFIVQIFSLIQSYVFYIIFPSDTKTVCEIGFNAGHSTLVWLESNPNVHVYTFDINGHPYTAPMVAYLQKTYPGRLTEHFGDSLTTVPQDSEKLKGKCDIVIVDGRHDKHYPRQDIVNMKKISHNDSLLIVDDTARTKGADFILNVVNTLVKENYLDTVFMCTNQKDRGFSAFTYR